MLECQRLYEFDSGLILDLNRVVAVHCMRTRLDSLLEVEYKEWVLTLEGDIKFTFDDRVNPRDKFVDALIEYLNHHEH